MSDTTAGFERLLAKSAEGKYVLRLYVAGATPRSAAAIMNLKALCEAHLPGRYELKVFDLYQDPERAKEGQIIAAPTLVKRFPPPLRRLIGDLSDTNRILLALDLAAENPSEHA